MLNHVASQQMCPDRRATVSMIHCVFDYVYIYTLLYSSLFNQLNLCFFCCMLFVLHESILIYIYIHILLCMHV